MISVSQSPIIFVKKILIKRSLSFWTCLPIDGKILHYKNLFLLFVFFINVV